MFVISDISKLRVYVNVPQSYVPAIKIGAKAVISMPEYPTRTFPATIEASSKSSMSAPARPACSLRSITPAAN